MSFTSGFFNANNHDRVYNATDFSKIFDGIINDGVFQNVGSSLIVSESSGMTVSVGSGRAWFHGTWSNNDGAVSLTLEQSELLLNRIDVIALEVNTTDSVRANTAKIIKGTPAATPEAPTLINADGVYQYPLAQIYIEANTSTITQANITNKVGSSETPFVTGILETVDTDDLIVQWQTQFNEWFDHMKDQLSTDAAGHLQTEIDAIAGDITKMRYGGI